MLEIPTCEERIVLTWDEDGATSRDMAIVLWYYDNGALDYLLIDSVSNVTLGLPYTKKVSVVVCADLGTKHIRATLLYHCGVSVAILNLLPLMCKRPALLGTRNLHGTGETTETGGKATFVFNPRLCYYYLLWSFLNMWYT